jgi:hypothetical protein
MSPPSFLKSNATTSSKTRSPKKPKASATSDKDNKPLSKKALSLTKPTPARIPTTSRDRPELSSPSTPSKTGIITPAPPPTPAWTPSPPPPITLPDLPYLISRTTTPSKSLPVYESVKSRTLLQTTIRRCSGDLALLKRHLLEALGMDESFIEERDGKKRENVKINHLTNSIVIRGYRGAEVRKWCSMVGF